MATDIKQAIYSRTAAGEAALSQPKIALSVTQRKLLSLVDGHTPLDQLTYDSVFEATRVERDIARLLELGLAAPPGAEAQELAGPLSDLRGRPENLAPSRSPKLALIGVAVLAVAGGAAAWFMTKPASESHAAPGVAGAINRASAAPDAQYFVRATQVKVGEDAPLNGPVVLPAPRPMNLPAAADAKATPAAKPEPVPVAPSRPATATASAPATTEAPAPATRTPVASTPAATSTQSPPPQVQSFATPAEAQRSATHTPPPTVVASAAPTAAPEAARAQPSRASMLTPISKVAPEFPREALSTGVEKGSVKVRLTIDRDGSVSKVDIVEANPRRVFDRAVQRALAQWKFTPGEDKRAAETEVNFNVNQ